jgi:hypothetical protein
MQLLTTTLACESDFYSIKAVPQVEACQQEATAPYCWPPNGSRLCYPEYKVQLYWPPSYYNDNETSQLSILSSYTPMNKADRAGSGRSSTDLDLSYFLADKIPGRPNERSINLTISERRWLNDSYMDYVTHQGPILILVDTSSASATPTPSPTATPEKPKEFKPGEIAGIGIGAFCGLVILVVLAYRYCAQCCLACCYPGEAERRRVRAAERKRIQQEREYAQPDVDAIKAAVTRGEVWQGPVRPGGMWVSRSNWPAAPRRVASPGSRGPRGDDEIRTVGGDQSGPEGRWMVDQRAEMHRIEEQRREELRGAERGEQIMRTEEGEPPAYEAPPPKYTP